MFDLLIIGGGPAAISCGLVLGSASEKPYMKGKKIGMIAYSKTSDLNGAVLNNLFGVASGTKGKDLLEKELEHVRSFSSIEQLPVAAVEAVLPKGGSFEVKTAEHTYQAQAVVLAMGHSTAISKIEGLGNYIGEHGNSLPGVKKTELKHSNLLVDKGLYVAGVLSGSASQAAIAAGEGANVAVQLLTLWNEGVFDHHHDK